MNSADSPTSPNREQLQRSLRELHAELERTPRVDAQSRQRLQVLLEELHARLHRARHSDAAPPPEAPSERLEELAVEFEAQHPVLAGSLRQFIELCSRAGL